MKPLIYMDIETFSPVNLQKQGPYRYSEDCEVLMIGWALDDEPAQVWDATDPAQYGCGERRTPRALNNALIEVIFGKREIVMHNGMSFDSTVLRRFFRGTTVVEAFEPENIIDTMVMAYQASLPGKLGDLCRVFNLSEDKAKDEDAGKLKNIFCKPLGKNRKLDRATRLTHPDDWARFVNYCRLDVESMREVYKCLSTFNRSDWERRIQVLDAKINRRGVCMDVELAQAAVKLSAVVKDSLNDRMAKATGGAVMTTSQTKALFEYIKERFQTDLENLTKAEVERAIDDPETPAPMRELLQLRSLGTKTSVKKFDALLACINSDGRLRGTLQFRGASRTGRWSGRHMQLQNLPRPSIKSADEMEFAIRLTKEGILPLVYDNLNLTLSDLIRGSIIASPGTKLCVADFSNIEGRVLAWLAGEEWKIKAFREVDAGRGHDLYKLAYSRAFGIRPEDVTKEQRQIGKVLELALGYGGGAPVFARMATNYGLDLEPMADGVSATISPKFWTAAENYYPKALSEGRTGDLPKKVFIACDALKRAWRDTNRRIVAFWDEVDAAVRGAMVDAKVTTAGRLRFKRCDPYLLMQLPSGRFLSYPQPRIGDGRDEPAFSYYGMVQQTREWKRIESRGSKVVENATQAVACDLLAEALLRLEAAGYKTVLHVHDEVIAEAPDTTEFSYEKMARIMAELPEWAPGIPVSAAGFESYRYRKE